MDEAERVLERLRRIERLEEDGAPASALLAEVRELLAEAEAWVRAEAPGDGRAETAVGSLRGALEATEEGALATERTLVA